MADPRVLQSVPGGNAFHRLGLDPIRPQGLPVDVFVIEPLFHLEYASLIHPHGR